MNELIRWPGGEWETVRQIGKGGYGSVYEIQRKEFGKVYRAAMKVMRIPPDDAYIQSMLYEGVSREKITESVTDHLKRLSEEFALLSNLKGYTNIVSYEDHKILRDLGGMSWTILIRMELLMPVKRYFSENKERYNEETIIRLGADICKALEICHSKNILHRDIKLDNLFVNESGDFELGDFGIAKISEDTAAGMTMVGTPTYMAPEVYRREGYGQSADLYSLGIALYMLLNRMRGPFYPLDRPITPDDRKKALNARISGKPVPEPLYGSRRLRAAVMKAIAYSPRDRYANAGEFRKALLGEEEGSPLEKAYRQALEMEKNACTVLDYEKAEGAFRILDAYKDSRMRADRCRLEADRLRAAVRTVPEPIRMEISGKPVPKQKKRHNGLMAGALVLALVLVIAVLLLWFIQERDIEEDLYIAESAEDADCITGSESLEELIRKAENGNEDAMIMLGNRYLSGEDAEQDYEKAAYWYQTAADAGNDKGMNNLAVLYMHGYGVGQDYEAALYWFLKSADAGNSRSMKLLGDLYKNGEGVEQDASLAAEWYLKAAEGGEVTAMKEAGDLYYYGLYVERDAERAAEWYKKGAEGGDAEAMDRYGDAFYGGDGVPMDHEQAAEWYLKGAEAGSASAMASIGFMYGAGDCVELDYDKAVEWYRKAIDGGNAWAMNLLGDAYYYGNGVEQDYAQAVQWYRKGAEGGNVSAMNNLGFMYEKGKGVEADPEQAKVWYRKGAEAGYEVAGENLRRLENKG